MTNENKTLKIEAILLDGAALGIIGYEFQTWRIEAHKISRAKVKDCHRSKDLKHQLATPGVYFLFSKEAHNADAVYIGQGKNVLKRLQVHLKKKKNWYEALTFTNEKNKLKKYKIDLEAYLYEAAKKGRIL